MNGDEVDYTYGEQQITQVYKPQYYSWVSEGYIGEDLPSDAKATVAELNPSYPFYLGLDVDSSNKVTAAYACFTRNETEYCLKGYDTDAYATNNTVLEDAYLDACSIGEGTSYCNAVGLYAYAYSYGYVDANDGYAVCYVDDVGNFGCNE